METAPAWEDCERTPHPPLTRDITADVCVVGLGASGLAALNEALEVGLHAVGIDASVLAAGASGRNGGFLMAGLAAFHHQVEHPSAAALYRHTLDEVRRSAIEHTGSIRLAHDDAEQADCDRQYAAMRADDLPVERIDGGLLFPDDGPVHPVRRALAMARGELYEHTPALGISSTISSARVTTPHATISCGAVVVAVDGKLEAVLPELRGRVRTARAQMLATAPTREVSIARPVYTRWGYDYWQQRADGSVVLGGCRDMFLDDEWTHDTAPTASVQDALERVLRERVGVHEAPVTHRWAGSIAFTDDGLPILEEVRPNVWAAGAYSGTGNVVGVLNARAALLRAVGHQSDWATLLGH